MDWIEKLYFGFTKKPDFYIEDGKTVFTESFHLKRGYCCGSGCRHCPYASKKEHPNQDQEPSTRQ